MGYSSSFLAIYLIAAPVWSAPGAGKRAVENSTEEKSANREDGEERNVAANGQKSQKKKVIKKAGTAAVVGVAGKKVASANKPDKNKRDE